MTPDYIQLSENEMDAIDAALYSGDMFYVKENRDALKAALIGWLNKLEDIESEAEEADQPLVITFTKNELDGMAKNPDVLRALANYHSAQETMADAIGDFKECVKFHEARRVELDAEADRIEAEWLAG